MITSTREAFDLGNEWAAGILAHVDQREIQATSAEDMDREFGCILENARQYYDFAFLAQELNDCGDGGFRVIFPGGSLDEAFDTAEDAAAAAEAEGLDDFEIIEVPHVDEAWEAFHDGVQHACWHAARRILSMGTD